MPKVALLKQDGSNVGEIELNDAVFGIEPNTHVLHEAVVMQRASLRQGTHAVKKTVLKFVVEAANHGAKKELAVHVKDLSVHHNGLAVELFSAQLRVATATNYQRKFVA